MKTCSALLIRKMWIITTMKYHLTLTALSVSEKTRHNRYRQGCGGREPVHFWWGRSKLVQPPWKTIREFLKGQKNSVIQQSSSECVSKGNKVIISRDYLYSCLLQHYHSSRRYRNKCPLTKEWLKKMCVCVYTHTHHHTHISFHIYAMEYYSTTTGERKSCHLQLHGWT